LPKRIENLVNEKRVRAKSEKFDILKLNPNNKKSNVRDSTMKKLPIKNKNTSSEFLARSDF
jgi:hypothetical protein